MKNDNKLGGEILIALNCWTLLFHTARPPLRGPIAHQSRVLKTDLLSLLLIWEEEGRPYSLSERDVSIVGSKISFRNIFHVDCISRESPPCPIKLKKHFYPISHIALSCEEVKCKQSSLIQLRMSWVVTLHSRTSVKVLRDPRKQKLGYCRWIYDVKLPYYMGWG